MPWVLIVADHPRNNLGAIGECSMRRSLLVCRGGGWFAASSRVRCAKRIFAAIQGSLGQLQVPPGRKAVPAIQVCASAWHSGDPGRIDSGQP